MTAPLPSPEEQAVIDRFEAAPDPEESLRARLADAFFWADPAMAMPCSDEDLVHCLRLADAAIAVMRGES